MIEWLSKFNTNQKKEIVKFLGIFYSTKNTPNYAGNFPYNSSIQTLRNDLARLEEKQPVFQSTIKYYLEQLITQWKAQVITFTSDQAVEDYLDKLEVSFTDVVMTLNTDKALDLDAGAKDTDSEEDEEEDEDDEYVYTTAIHSERMEVDGNSAHETSSLSDDLISLDEAPPARHKKNVNRHHYPIGVYSQQEDIIHVSTRSNIRLVYDKISYTVRGIYFRSMCGLMKLPLDQTHFPQEIIQATHQGKDTIILFGDELFYYHQAKLKPIAITDVNRAAASALKNKFTADYQFVSMADQDLVTAATGETPRFELARINLSSHDNFFSLPFAPIEVDGDLAFLRKPKDYHFHFGKYLVVQNKHVCTRPNTNFIDELNNSENRVIVSNQFFKDMQLSRRANYDPFAMEDAPLPILTKGVPKKKMKPIELAESPCLPDMGGEPVTVSASAVTTLPTTEATNSTEEAALALVNMSTMDVDSNHSQPLSSQGDEPETKTSQHVKPKQSDSPLPSPKRAEKRLRTEDLLDGEITAPIYVSIPTRYRTEKLETELRCSLLNIRMEPNGQLIDILVTAPYRDEDFYYVIPFIEGDLHKHLKRLLTRKEKGITSKVFSILDFVTIQGDTGNEQLFQNEGVNLVEALNEERDVYLLELPGSLFNWPKIIELSENPFSDKTSKTSDLAPSPNEKPVETTARTTIEPPLKRRRTQNDSPRFFAIPSQLPPLPSVDGNPITPSPSSLSEDQEMTPASSNSGFYKPQKANGIVAQFLVKNDFNFPEFSLRLRRDMLMAYSKNCQVEEQYLTRKLVAPHFRENLDDFLTAMKSLDVDKQLARIRSYFLEIKTRFGNNMDAMQQELEASDVFENGAEKVMVFTK